MPSKNLINYSFNANDTYLAKPSFLFRKRVDIIQPSFFPGCVGDIKVNKKKKMRRKFSFIQ